MLTPEKQKKEYESGKWGIIYVVIALIIALGLIVFVSLRLLRKDSNGKLQEPIEISENLIAETTNATDQVTTSANIENAIPSDADIDHIIERATLGVENFTYTVYCQLDTKWNQELSDEAIRQLVTLGLNKRALDGISILALVGNITPTTEILTVLSQHSMLNDIESRSTQTFFDFKRLKSFSQTNDLLTQSSTDWKLEDITAEHLLFENFFTDLTFNSINENTDNYIINGLYKYNPSGKNNIDWIMAYIFSLYDLRPTRDIPFYVVIDKSNMQVLEFVYDLDELKNMTILDTYDIIGTQFKIGIKDINATTAILPDELQKKLN